MKSEQGQIQMKSTQGEEDENLWNFSQSFLLKNNTIHHEKIVKVEKADTTIPQLEIKNNYCYKQDLKVVKVTVLHIEDNFIKVIDIFTFTPEKQLKKNNNKHYIHDVSDSQFKARNVRNGVKNIIKLFQRWLEQKSPPDFQLIDQLEQLIKKNGTHNNNVIIMIAKNIGLRRAFLAFSQNQAEQLINQSKIHDKNSHHLALRKYKMICHNSEEAEINEQNSLKKFIEEDLNFDIKSKEEEFLKQKTIKDQTLEKIMTEFMQKL